MHHDKDLNDLFAALVLTVGLILINVVLTVNGMSPFQLLGL